MAKTGSRGIKKMTDFHMSADEYDKIFKNQKENKMNVNLPIKYSPEHGEVFNDIKTTYSVENHQGGIYIDRTFNLYDCLTIAPVYDEDKDIFIFEHSGDKKIALYRWNVEDHIWELLQ